MKKKIYNKREFEELVDKSKFQTFFFISKVTFPFFFAIHPWLVINNKGKLQRIEIMSHEHYLAYNHPVKKNSKLKDHLFISSTHLSVPMRRFSSGKNKYKFSKIIGYVEGKEAKRIIDFTNSKVKSYSHKKEYSYYPGPNSNTFIQWILNHFSELKIKLPWNAFGKNWKK